MIAYDRSRGEVNSKTDFIHKICRSNIRSLEYRKKKNNSDTNPTISKQMSWHVIPIKNLGPQKFILEQEQCLTVEYVTDFILCHNCNGSSIFSKRRLQTEIIMNKNHFYHKEYKL